MKKEKLWTRDYVILLLTSFISSITSSAFLSVFPVYVLDAGGDTTVIGYIATGLVIACMIARIICGKLQDRFGRRIMTVIGALLYALNTIGFYVFHDIRVIYALRIMNGISSGIFAAAIGTLVADIVHPSRLVEGLSYYSTSIYVAMVFCPTVGSLIYTRCGSSVLFFICACSAVISFVTAMLIHDPSGNKKAEKKAEKREDKEKTGFSLTSIFEPKVIAPALIYGIIFISYSAISNYITPFGRAAGIDQISLYFTFYSLAAIVIRILNQKIIGLLGERRVIVIGLVSCMLAYVSLALATNMALVILCGVFFGAGFGMCSPIINASVFRLVPENRKGIANATYGLFGDAGAGIGGIVWGYICLSSYRVVYWSAAVISLFTLIVYFTMLRPKYVKGEI